MASINKIVNQATNGKVNTQNLSVEGVNEQILSNVNELNESVSSAKKNVQAAATSTVNSYKQGVEKATSNVKGMIPGTSNGYTLRASDEKQKSYNAADGTYSNINFNDLILPYENPLLSYHQYTWNFSLYTMNATEYEFFLDNSDADVSKYVIAQSGVTGRYSINSVKMTSAGPATPGLTSNYSLNTCVLELQENGGMSLFDDLIVLSNELGYKKFMDIPVILELNFVGYDQDTGMAMNIPGLNRKWGVRINTITGSASPSGGSMTYTFTMTSTRGGIMENKDWTLMEPYTCTTGNFGEFVQQLEDHLNKVATDQYGYLRYRYAQFANDKYFEIKCPTELANMTINYDVKQSPEVNQSPNGSSAAKQFTWGADVPVSRVIDDILDCCMPLHESTDKRRQFVNIIPVSRYVGFDPIRNTSAFKSFFYILKYKIGDVTSKDDLAPESFNLQYFYENADKIVDETDPNKIPKINAKRYDYQFSGLNNEIINLDLKYDQGFNIAVVRNPQSQIDPSNSSGTHVAETLELAGQEYSTSDSAALWSKSQSLLREQENGRQLTDEERQFIRDAQGVAASQVMPVEGETDQSRYNLSLSAALPQYIEDFRKDIDLTTEGTNGIGSPRVDSIPVEPTNIKQTNSGSKGDNSSDDELERRLVRDNYYNRSFLAKLDIKVVGDPFWLGWGDYSYMKYLQRAVEGQDINPDPSDIHFANFLTTETYLLLNLKPIVAISDETGILEVNQSSVFAQTFYRVNKVVSEFNSNGTFTQQITGGLVIRSLRKKDQYTDVTESTESIKKNGKTQ
ncbi:virion structural protein [Cronobacter phage vB_CsaM_GAP32]|uniref:Uncharacterized protein n=1 Tax=Cronobacter phage vB_CsaM_GAP32 TaxID=1141136 RepID=K4F9K7_9CAUD|nr:virion structural protein [Cronobacter phage vB_CsaM_GAP32]AFC21685.1 hypothetical protein GAP32_235 [Cronobacter phage vB_CsaM_GAP32]